MKNKHDEGFSLIELLVAIVILTAIVVPTCSALVMTNEMNNRSDDLMKAQLAVSSAVEILMAEGISTELQKAVEENGEDTQVIVQDDTYYVKTYENEDVRFPAVKITLTEMKEKVGETYVLMPWYAVRVCSTDGLVEVDTSIRKVS